MDEAVRERRLLKVSVNSVAKMCDEWCLPYLNLVTGSCRASIVFLGGARSLGMRCCMILVCAVTYGAGDV